MLLDGIQDPGNVGTIIRTQTERLVLVRRANDPEGFLTQQIAGIVADDAEGPQS